MAEVTRTRIQGSLDSYVMIVYTFQYDEFDYPDWDPWDPETDPLHVKDGGTFDENNMELDRAVDVLVQVVGPDTWEVAVLLPNGNPWIPAFMVTAASPATERPRGQLRTAGDIAEVTATKVS